MPTEATFLFAGLLFLAAGLGYLFARFGDIADEQTQQSQPASRPNFLRGFRYLLNDEPDRAVEVFTQAEHLGDEATETQLALGSLFRRRGELDRAIRLHQNLLDRASSTPAQRESASFALAEDYLGAGLFDRAEELFIPLRKSPRHGPEALSRLLRICEVTSDWDRAVNLCREMQQVGPSLVSGSQWAHYYCELAEEACRGEAPDIARNLLAQADGVDPGKIRSALIRADLDIAAGHTVSALDGLSRLTQSPSAPLWEILVRLLLLAKSPEGRLRVTDTLADVASTPSGLRALALCVLRDPTLKDPVVLSHLAAFVAQQPVLSSLVGFSDQGVGESWDGLDRLRAVIHKMLGGGIGFQCQNCGYASASAQWQCPGCRTWDSVQPVSSPVVEKFLS